MDDLVYSADALNVIDDFYGVSTIVYVEGNDDEIFWKKIFNRFYSKSFEIKYLGGKPELIKAAKSLADNAQLEYIVALDLDYSLFNNELPEHPKIVTTFGHSIENTLIQKKSIFILSENCGLSDDMIVKEFDTLHSSIEAIVDELLPLDIYNYSNDKKSVIGKNIQQSSKKGKIYRIKSEDLKVYLDDSLSSDFNEYVRTTYDSSRLTAIDIINGHFLSSMLLKFLNLNSKKFRDSLSLSNDALIINLFTAFDNSFNKEHPHYNFYSDIVGSLNEKLLT